MRAIASGGETEAVSQLSAELRALSKAERQQLLNEAQLPIVIPLEHSLAIKTDLGLPWNKLRVLRRYT